MSVGKSTVDAWPRKLRKERGGEVVPGTPISEEQREIKALAHEIKQLKMEKDIIKKATALMMSDSMNGLR